MSADAALSADRAARAPRRGSARAAMLGALVLAGALSACGEGAADASHPPKGAPASAPTTPAAAGLRDVAAASGIDFLHEHGGRGRKFLFETMGSGVAAADFDGDGLPDLLFVQSGTLPEDEFTEEERAFATHRSGGTARLYKNLGGWRFADITAGSGLDVPFYAMGVAVGDLDADGDRDLHVTAYGRSRLFINDGQARFREEGRERGLSDPPWTAASAFVDVDLDGDLDLYSVAYLDMPVASHVFCGPSKELRSYCHVDYWPGLDDRLWINDGRGHFTDGSAAAGLVGTLGKGLAVVAADLDGDGDPELFVANDSQPNLLLRNEGGGRFSEIARAAGVDLNAEGRSEACMGVDAGDLDGDGDADLYVVNFQQESNTLYRNDGRLFFTDVSVSSGAGIPSLSSLGFGTLFFDAELDGDLDIYVANGHIQDNIERLESLSSYAQRDQLYLGDGRGRFALAPESLGDSLRVPRVGRGAARVDLDRDGDDDLVVTNSAGAPWVLRNDLPADGAGRHRIALRLAGPGGRADAEGAQLVLHCGERRIVRQLVSGGSYASHSDTELVIGLGGAERVESLEIRWPGGATSRHGPLAADRRYLIDYGGTNVREEPFVDPAEVSR